MTPFTLIAGPCVVENETTPLEVAQRVKELCEGKGWRYIFKASYRKANRTSLDSFTGIGDEKALRIIKEIGQTLGIETITDVHESSEVVLASKYVDHLQIPAFLCRQTDLLLAAGQTGCGVNIKKGQFLSPEAMRFPLEKVQSTGNDQVWLCERGTSFGYQELIVDTTAVMRLKKLGAPVIMDCTHATQQPNRTEGVTGGNPDFIEAIALSAVVNRCDGLFIETHPDPQAALSDGQTMLPLQLLAPLLDKVDKVHKAISQEVS